MHNEQSESTISSDPGRDNLLAVLDSWKNKLVSFDGRNRQIYYKNLKTGDVDFADEYLDQETLKKLLAGETIRLSVLYKKLFNEKDNKELEIDESQPVEELPLEKQWVRRLKRFETVYKKSKENFEERNISTCFLADGFISWSTGKTGAVPNAPLFFHQISIKPIARGNSDFSLVKVGDVFVNDTLKIHLKKDFGIEYNVFDIDEDINLSEAKLKPILDILQKSLPGFTFKKTQILGNFSFHKLPMYKDMERIISTRTSHEILSALAGSKEAKEKINAQGREKNYEELSNLDVELEHLIFPADSSQHNAISAVMGGKSIVIQGPPGSGKSQTIANLIAEAVAANKKILFVAEKRAAIDAVVERLGEKKLSDIVLDLHGEPDKRTIANNLLAAVKNMQLPSSLDNREQANLNFAKRQLQERWNWMNSDSGLHSRLGVRLSNRDVYSELGTLRGGLSKKVVSQAMFISKSIEVNQEENYESFLDALNNLFVAGYFSAEYKANVQVEGFKKFVNDAELQDFTSELIDMASLFENISWQQVIGIAENLIPDFKYDFSQLLGLIGILEDIEVFTTIFNEHTIEEVDALKNCLLSFSDYKNVTKQNTLKAAYSRRVLRKEFQQLLSEDFALENQKLYQLITRVSIISNKLGNNDSDFRELASRSLEYRKFISDSVALSKRLKAIFMVLEKNEDVTFEYFEKQIAVYLPLRSLILKMPLINRELNRISKLNLRNVLDAITELELDRKSAFIFWNLVWLNKSMIDSQLELFTNKNLDFHDAINQFRELDRKHLNGNPTRLLKAISSKYLVLPSDDISLLNKESQKKTHHLPFRTLFDKIPTSILTLKPVIAMSPLAVSQLMPCTEKMFDIVIFDEASQIRPEEAMTSIYRAKQVVIAGDRFQLPPTSFGEANMEDDFDSLNEALQEDVTQGMESILTAANAIFDQKSHIKPLRLHYRSNDEKLILWSNFHIYMQAGESLFTFPSTKIDARESIRYSYLKDVRTQNMDEPNYSEIEEVKNVVLNHITNHPNLSLGVIAFGIKHAMRLEDEFVQLEKTNSDFYYWKSKFAETREKFFVKNIERVQGDERDAIILSPGYAPNLEGLVPLQFGTLNRQGGERRLNVAASRAKEYVHLVTSLRSSDIDLNRTKSASIKLFRSYLEFIENEGKLFSENFERAGTDSPFEDEILKALREKGLLVECQVGDSGFRIDFAIKDPNTNKFVLAVEADGATYHSSEYVRERDYMRQAILEGRGWKFIRIWSSDWWQDPEHEVQRVLLELETISKSSEINSLGAEDLSSYEKADREKEDPSHLGDMLGNIIEHHPKSSKADIFQLWLRAIGRIRTSALIELEFESLWEQLRN